MKSTKSKPQQMKVYASFTEWKKDQTPDNQKIIDRLQNLIKNVAPHFDTTVKWGQGCFVHGQSPRVFIHAETGYVQLGFYNGSTLKDTFRLLEGKGKYVRHVKVHSVEEIDEPKFSDLLKQVAN